MDAHMQRVKINFLVVTIYFMVYILLPLGLLGLIFLLPKGVDTP